MRDSMRVAAIEAGGTKFVLGIIESDGPLEAPKLLARGRINTQDPATTVDEAAAWFRAAFESFGSMQRMGIASFGPLAGRFGAADWGRIGKTPKPGWSGFDLAGSMRERLGMTIAMDTDVNAAALAEGRWGASRGLADHVYVTVGTGIGEGGATAGSSVRWRCAFLSASLIRLIG